MTPNHLSLTHVPTEWGFHSTRTYPDPFQDVDLDVVFSDPDGAEIRVPAFWSGDRSWRVRFAGRKPGRYLWRSECSDTSNACLHGISGSLEVAPYEGSNRLFQHGPLRLSADRRTLEHLDGTPFFWLGDTWWMGLCKRLSWPGDFQLLAADRVAKGFSVIQIVAGLYPDMDAFDERGANEAGFPWQPEWASLRPEYFDMADLRIHWLVRSGLVPCIVSSWGYYLPRLGITRMKRHWRYLVARYGAFPVAWCLTGEVLMPYYLGRPATPQDLQAYRDRVRADWNEVLAYLRSLDPYHHPITVHPCGGQSARESLRDDLLDFDMLQTGHSDRSSLPGTVECVTRSYSREPVMPVINGEVCYEGIGEASRQEIQRLMFWVCMLSGAAGHTYGANGIWQLNTREKPYGPSPHGMSWGDTPWEDACQLPGSHQLGLGKALLERYPWWQFRPHPEWADPRWSKENSTGPYAAGIPGRVRILYLPTYLRLNAVQHLEPDIAYRAFYFDPKNGREYALGDAQADAGGRWQPPKPPIFQDWLLVLEKV